MWNRKGIQCFSYMRSLQILFETRISASGSRTSWMKNQPQQELEPVLKSKPSPALHILPFFFFFWPELHREETTTTFKIGTEEFKHVYLWQGFPQWIQQPSHSFCTTPYMCGIAWHCCESPVNTPRASPYVKTTPALNSIFLKQYSS